MLDRPAREHPRVLILGGPQGSGKSTALPLVQRQLNMTEAVRLDGDDIMALHPRFEPYARVHGGLAAARLVAPDYRILVARMLEEVRQAKQDLVLVGPYTHPEATFERLDYFRAEGYEAEMAYMAVHPARSELGVMHRHYQAMTDGTGYSLLIPLELQRSVIDGTPRILDAAQVRGTVRALHAVGRSGVLASTRRQADGSWTPPIAMSARVEEIRREPWNRETQARFQQDRADVAAIQAADWVERLASVDSLAVPMLTAAVDGSEPDEELRNVLRLGGLGFGPATRAERSGWSQEGAGGGRGSEHDRSHSNGLDR
ncbi:zeta toxin family protein [Streptomyces sp. NBC_01431]|uniref:zeta toxin family protein n=1 Tax=Streptomyces sp. NBC_01431 TaxID=2903863 RepID=UPI002E301337|nr:zeta toxin family protein [Streptomyces sp. NBC_01431]